MAQMSNYHTRINIIKLYRFSDYKALGLNYFYDSLVRIRCRADCVRRWQLAPDFALELLIKSVQARFAFQQQDQRNKFHSQELILCCAKLMSQIKYKLN